MKTSSLVVLAGILFVGAGIYVSGVIPLVLTQGQATVLPESTDVAQELAPMPIAREEVLTVEQLLVRVQELEGQGRYGEALTLLLAEEKKGTSSSDVLLHIGRMFAKQGQYDKAATYFQQILEATPTHTATLLEVLHMHLVLEQYGAFAALYPTIPDTVVEKYYYQGLYLIFTGKEQEAYGVFKDLLAKDTLKRAIRSASDRLLASFDEFRLYAGGNAVHLKTILARTLVEGGELQLAERLLRTVIEEKKDYVDGWILLGYTYYLQKEYDRAFTAFDTAYTLNAIAPDIQFYLGITKEKQQQYSEALQYLALAQENGYQPVVEIKRRMADIYVETEQYDTAVALYEEVLQLDDRKELAQYVRPLWIYIDVLQRPNDALRLAELAIQQDPKDAMANNLLGWSYLAKKDYANAERYLLQALSYDRGLAAAYLNLGKLYQETGNIENARTFYQRAYVMGEGTGVGNTAAHLYNTLIQ